MLFRSRRIERLNNLDFRPVNQLPREVFRQNILLNPLLIEHIEAREEARALALEQAILEGRVRDDSREQLLLNVFILLIVILYIIWNVFGSENFKLFLIQQNIPFNIIKILRQIVESINIRLNPEENIYFKNISVITFVLILNFCFIYLAKIGRAHV